MDIRDLLEFHEGRRYRTYYDSLGNPTIGVGHLLPLNINMTWSDAQIDAQLEQDIAHAEDMLRRYVPGFEALDPVRRMVLTDMCFNMGYGKLTAFKRFMIALRCRQYGSAADEMLKSKWATQVGARATRLATMMRTGEYPKDVPARKPRA
jgi:lysozyme